MKATSKVNKKANRQKPTPVKTRSLVVLDNAPIRKKSITLAQGWLKKIEDTEKSVRKFQEIDLKLYTDWYNLTLNPLIESIDEMRQEFISAAEFHNLLVMISKEKNIPMPMAHLFLQNEDEEFKSGDNNTRTRITAIRAARTKAFENEMRQQNESGSYSGDDNDNSNDNDDVDSSHSHHLKEAIDALKLEEDLVKKSREKYKKQIENYERITDKKLTKIMRSFEEGFSFLVEAISILSASSRVDLLRRFWKFASKSLKTFLNKQSRLDFGISIDDMMNDIEERDQIRASFFAYEESSKDNLDNFDDSEDGFANDFFMGFGLKKENFKKDLLEDDRIRIKSIYRKIVRRIHPDNFNLELPSDLKSWFKIIWQDVALAHKDEDLEKLTLLHHKIVIALGDFDELSVSDLNAAAKDLASEHETLLEEYSSLTDNPAWNFSQLRDFKKLKNKLSKPFLGQQKRLKEDLENLKEQRFEIERIAGLIKEGKIKLRPSKKARRKVPGRRRPSMRSSDRNSQMNFSMD